MKTVCLRKAEIVERSRDRVGECTYATGAPTVSTPTNYSDMLRSRDEGREGYEKKTRGRGPGMDPPAEPQNPECDGTSQSHWHSVDDIVSLRCILATAMPPPEYGAKAIPRTLVPRSISTTDEKLQQHKCTRAVYVGRVCKVQEHLSGYQADGVVEHPLGKAERQSGEREAPRPLRGVHIRNLRWNLVKD